MYAIPEYDNLLLFRFFSVMSHKNITLELNSTFIMNERKRLLPTPDYIYSDVSSSPIEYNGDAKDYIIHEFWFPCENNKVGAPGIMSKRLLLLSDILLGSSFLLDSPRHINSL